MVPWLVVLIPILAGLASYLLRRRRWVLTALLLFTALFHSAATLCLIMRPGVRCEGSAWLGVDEIGVWVLAVTSVLFFFVSFHTAMWLPEEERYAREHGDELLPAHVFLPCMELFLGMMNMIVLSRNLGLTWIAIEATTLVSAPLILFRRSRASLEAMWKYLLICSVGAGLALFGTLLVAISARGTGCNGLGFAELLLCSDGLEPRWFMAGFIFILVGYGTKMGLAPFHTWLPDTLAEAPGVVSALLSGALLNCSFLGIVRFWQVAPQFIRPFCDKLLIALGVLSLLTALFFIVGQVDFKRMLAYASVGHMGFIAFLWGLGQHEASLMHMFGYALMIMTLFLLAGNIVFVYRTRSVSKFGGMFERLPRHAVLWIVALLLLNGAPPSPLFTFVTEYILVRSSSLWLGITVLTLLFGVFAGMTRIGLKMCMGSAGEVDVSTEQARTTERLCGIPVLATILAICGGLLIMLLMSRGEL